MSNSYCTNCGKEITLNNKFCGFCGTQQVTQGASIQMTEYGHNSKKPRTRSSKSLNAFVVSILAFFFLALFGFRLLSHSSKSVSIISVSSSDSQNQSPRATVEFAGNGGLDEKTDAKTLSGSYKVVWKTLGDCSYFASLGDVDIFSADSATAGSNYVTNLAKSEYRISLITGPSPECGWTAKFIPTK